MVNLYFFVCCSKFLFPIFFSEDLLYRCVPSTLLGEKVQLLFDFLNSSDTFQQALSDLYASWKEMILLCLLALGRTFFSIFSSPGLKGHVNYCHYFTSIIVCKCFYFSMFFPEATEFLECSQYVCDYRSDSNMTARDN